jgi:hypothetical protein
VFYFATPTYDLNYVLKPLRVKALHKSDQPLGIRTASGSDRPGIQQQ